MCSTSHLHLYLLVVNMCITRLLWLWCARMLLALVATMRRLGELASVLRTKRMPTRMTRPMISIRNINRHWTPWRRNTLTSRPPWQMSQASTRKGDVLHAATLEVAEELERTRKIKAVYRTIWTARATHWPRQPKNFQTAGQHTRPRALNFVTLSGTFGTDVQLMMYFASMQRRRCIEHSKFSARQRRYKMAWRHTGRELDVLQMSTPGPKDTSTMALALCVEPCKPQPKPRTP